MATQEPIRDDELTEVTKKVVNLVTRKHPLTGNQLFDLAAQLQRVATHRIIEEHIRQYGRRAKPS